MENEGKNVYLTIKEWDETSHEYTEQENKEPLFPIEPKFENLLMFLQVVSTSETKNKIKEWEIDFDFFLEHFGEYKWNKESCDIIIQLIKLNENKEEGIIFGFKIR